MPTELYHHGIKGMKWGIRRYQNPDGSLTPAGKKRAQKQYDKKYKKNYAKAYNSASKYANDTLIPELNRKYARYDFSDLSDPRIKRIYDQYEAEFYDKFNSVFDKKMKDLIGERPN